MGKEFVTKNNKKKNTFMVPQKYKAKSNNTANSVALLCKLFLNGEWWKFTTSYLPFVLHLPI